VERKCVVRKGVSGLTNPLSNTPPHIFLSPTIGGVFESGFGDSVTRHFPFPLCHAVPHPSPLSIKCNWKWPHMCLYLLSHFQLYLIDKYGDGCSVPFNGYLSGASMKTQWKCGVSFIKRVWPHFHWFFMKRSKGNLRDAVPTCGAVSTHHQQALTSKRVLFNMYAHILVY